MYGSRTAAVVNERLGYALVALGVGTTVGLVAI
jgi:hypothetical protein